MSKELTSEQKKELLEKQKCCRNFVECGWNGEWVYMDKEHHEKWSIPGPVLNEWHLVFNFNSPKVTKENVLL